MLRDGEYPEPARFARLEDVDSEDLLDEERFT